MTKQAELKKHAYESNLKSRALSVLIYLIDRSNQDLTCFPSIPTMAKQLHISVSTVKRALHELIEERYVEKEARFRDNNGQSSNLYTLLSSHERDVFIATREDGSCDISDSEDTENSWIPLSDNDQAACGDLETNSVRPYTVSEEGREGMRNEIRFISFGDIIAEESKKNQNMNQVSCQSSRSKPIQVQDNKYGQGDFITDDKQKPYHWTGEEVILLPP